MNLRVKSFFVFSLLGLANPVFSQLDDGFINGVLLDGQTEEPIVFATVRVKGKAIGVISNNDGGFKIPSEFRLKGDSLEISSMGFETKQVGFAELKESVINRIFLKPYALELSETIVTARRRRFLTKVKGRLTAEKIIAYAIERIPDNYKKNPFELVGYYRDYQLREQNYLNLNEALIKVFDKGFEVQNYSSFQFGLYNYKSNSNFKVDSLAAKPYDYETKDKYIPNTKFKNTYLKNELVLLFNHDAIRNNNQLSYSFVDTFTEDFIRKHDFITYFLTNYGEKEVYKIKFEKSTVSFQVKGTIYIDVDSYAIRKLDYALYQKGDETSASNFEELEDGLLYEIFVEYKEHDNYMYLNYISFHNKFKLVRPPKFYVKKIIRNYDTTEMLVELNKPALNWRSLKPKDFYFYYDGSKLRVDGLLQKDVASYKFEFSRFSKSRRKKVRQLFRELGTKDVKPIIVVIKNMIDLDGNLLGKENAEFLDQYREFFTQGITTTNERIEEDNLMIKSLPLESGKQPISNGTLQGGYWKNTPLHTPKN